MSAPGAISEPLPDARTETRLRRVAGLATAGMTALSWPLWVGTEDFPTVPFFPALPTTRGPAAWAVFLVMLAALVATALGRRRWRRWFALSVVPLAFLIGQDQHRFQPWAYQYAMTVLFLAALPGGEGLKYARWWFIALYAHSGLSKLDVSFVRELGPNFLRASVAPLGLDPSRWTESWRLSAILAMPALEIAVAAALAAPGWRRFGRVGAAALHGALIFVLGPTGLNQSAIVLAWNAAMLAEVWIAFGADLARAREPVQGGWRSVPVKAIFWAGALLPFGERWGAFDAWPSHALYASHVERVAVWLHESAGDRFPDAVQHHLLDGGVGPWTRLDLTGWSRAVRGTPVYPANRACLGLAEALADRYGGPRSVRVVAFGQADRWTGGRRRVEANGLDAIRGLGDRSWCNAHPARRGGRRRDGEPRSSSQ